VGTLNGGLDSPRGLAADEILNLPGELAGDGLLREDEIGDCH
jgi:hypothetical protein